MIHIQKAAELINDLLDPESLGHSATAEIRDRARECVGLPRCETPEPKKPGHDAGSWRK